MSNTATGTQEAPGVAASDASGEAPGQAVATLQVTAHLADVPLDIEVELGRKIMSLETVLGLAQGVVIKLPRSAGENIDILAGGYAFASGEIVIIEERFGVRITDFRVEE